MLRMPMQRDQRIADHVGGGFVAGKEQQDHVGDDLLIVQAAAVVLGLDEARNQIVAAIAATLRDHAVEIPCQLVVGNAGGLQFFRRHHRIEDVCQRAGRVTQRGDIGCIDIQHPADDGDRQRERELGQQIAVAVGLEIIDQAGGGIAGDLTHGLHLPRTEGLGHQCAQLRVQRRIEQQEHTAHALKQRHVHRRLAVAQTNALQIVATDPSVA